MKLSVDWLKEYVRTDLDAGALAEVLSGLGFPCDGIHRSGSDSVIDLEVTSNRGDCLGYIGVARELAAATGAELTLPRIFFEESARGAGGLVTVENRRPEWCCRYTARVIENVRVGPSPDNVRKRLESVGLRSVNNVVDATNYAMLETGHPPHAFDYDRIEGRRVVIRNALEAEQITSIDGTICRLEDDTLVIADARRPVAIAGVMGGADTEVSNATSTILLEEAFFTPLSVRNSARRYGLFSEAAFRFERTVDIQQVEWASRRTAQLIVQMAGGIAASGVVDVYPSPPAACGAVLRLSRLNKLLGFEIPVQDVLKILSSLHFQPIHQGDNIACRVPSWRSDVRREADLVEEVCRVYGYDRVPTGRKIRIEIAPIDRRQEVLMGLGNCLNGCGFYEAVTVSFVERRLAQSFCATGAGGGLLAVNDAVDRSERVLRSSLLGSLMGVLKSNANAGNRPCRLFEVADTFMPDPGRGGGLPAERTCLSLVCDGDLRFLRGVIEAAMRVLDRDTQTDFRPAHLPWADPCAEILVGGTVLGVAGMVNRELRQRFDLSDVDVAAAELDLELLMGLSRQHPIARDIPRYPAVQRDLSIVVNDATSWSQIAGAVKCAAPSELEKLEYVGDYRGGGIDDGRKSITLSLRFRHPDGTLTHEQVDGFVEAILERLCEKVGARLRQG